MKVWDQARIEVEILSVICDYVPQTKGRGMFFGIGVALTRWVCKISHELVGGLEPNFHGCYIRKL